MKKFVVFYRKNTITGALYQCCGSMATINVDGRLSRSNICGLATEHAKQNNYHGFQLQWGESIRTMRPFELWVHKVQGA